MNNTTNSTVAQLNSTLGKNLFNELTLNYTTIRDKRSTDDTLFPQVNVTVAGGKSFTAGSRAVLGRQRSGPGHHRADRQPDLVHGQAHLHHRHPQRILQFRKPFHPQLLRLLGIRQS